MRTRAHAAAKLAFVVAVLFISSFLSNSALAADEVCTAQDVWNLVGCNAGDSSCKIDTPIDVAHDCTLDFGSQAIEVNANIGTVGFNETFTILAGSLAISGKEVAAKGKSGFDGGSIYISVDGLFSMGGIGASVNVDGGDDGGVIEINAGDVSVGGGSITANAGGSDWDGGIIRIRATTGDVFLDAAVRAKSSEGVSATGGVIEISGHDITVKKILDAKGDAGGGTEVKIVATGDLTLSGNVDTSGGTALEDEDAFGGSGGDIKLYSDGDLRVSGSLTAHGGNPDGFGGNVELFSGGLLELDGPIDADGVGSDSVGGNVELRAETTLTVKKNITANAPETGGSFGGSIKMVSNGNLTIESNSNVRANAGYFAGDILLDSASQVLIDGKLEAKDTNGADSTQTGSSEGIIDIQGCSVTVNGILDVRGLQDFAGDNTIRAKDIVIGNNAKLFATDCGASAGSSCNHFITHPEGSIQNDGLVDPAADTATDNDFLPCCGNGVPETTLGEVCDDGNRAFCDSCGAACQPEDTPACGGNECFSGVCDPENRL